MYSAAFIISAIGEKEQDALPVAVENMGAMLRALISINVSTLKRHLDRFKPLYQAGIIYGESNIVVCRDIDDNWIDIVALYEAGRGTCKELAAARIAECRVRFGMPAATQKKPFYNGIGPFITMEEDPETGHDQYHVLVRWPDQKPRGGYPSSVRYDKDFKAWIECPSTVLGMGRMAA